MLNIEVLDFPLLVDPSFCLQMLCTTNILIIENVCSYLYTVQYVRIENCMDCEFGCQLDPAKFFVGCGPYSTHASVSECGGIFKTNYFHNTCAVVRVSGVGCSLAEMWKGLYRN